MLRQAARRVHLTRLLVAGVFAAGFACAAARCVGKDAYLALDDLWEDTPATRNLVHRFCIYKRIPLPNRLHRQL